MPAKSPDGSKSALNVAMTKGEARQVAYALLEYLQAYQTAKLMQVNGRRALSSPAGQSNGNGRRPALPLVTMSVHDFDHELFG